MTFAFQNKVFREEDILNDFEHRSFDFLDRDDTVV